MRRADGKLDAVDHDRHCAADVLRALEPIGQQFEPAAAAFPAQGFRCDFDKIYHTAIIDFGRQLLEIGKSNAERSQRRGLFTNLHRVDAEFGEVGLRIADYVDM